MSFSGSQTTTFSVVDIRKVVDCFAADFSMKAQSTGLRTRESVTDTVSDLRFLAEHGYLIDVKLILKDSQGNQIRGTVYKVSDNAIGWASDRPGNNLWPRTPGGRLKVVATLTQEWWDLSVAEKADLASRNGLNSSWDLTSEDTSFSGLVATPGQRYASNGYGWERTNYG